MHFFSKKNKRNAGKIFLVQYYDVFVLGKFELIEYFNFYILLNRSFEFNSCLKFLKSSQSSGHLDKHKDALANKWNSTEKLTSVYVWLYLRSVDI